MAGTPGSNVSGAGCTVDSLDLSSPFYPDYTCSTPDFLGFHSNEAATWQPQAYGASGAIEHVTSSNYAENGVSAATGATEAPLVQVAADLARCLALTTNASPEHILEAVVGLQLYYIVEKGAAAALPAEWPDCATGNGGHALLQGSSKASPYRAVFGGPGGSLILSLGTIDSLFEGWFVITMYGDRCVQHCSDASIAPHAFKTKECVGHATTKLRKLVLGVTGELRDRIRMPNGQRRLEAWKSGKYSKAETELFVDKSGPACFLYSDRLKPQDRIGPAQTPGAAGSSAAAGSGAVGSREDRFAPLLRAAAEEAAQYMKALGLVPLPGTAPQAPAWQPVLSAAAVSAAAPTALAALPPQPAAAEAAFGQPSAAMQAMSDFNMIAQPQQAPSALLQGGEPLSSLLPGSGAAPAPYVALMAPFVGSVGDPGSLPSRQSGHAAPWLLQVAAYGGAAEPLAAHAVSEIAVQPPRGAWVPDTAQTESGAAPAAPFASHLQQLQLPFGNARSTTLQQLVGQAGGSSTALDADGASCAFISAGATGAAPQPLAGAAGDVAPPVGCSGTAAAGVGSGAAVAATCSAAGAAAAGLEPADERQARRLRTDDEVDQQRRLALIEAVCAPRRAFGAPAQRRAQCIAALDAALAAHPGPPFLQHPANPDATLAHVLAAPPDCNVTKFQDASGIDDEEARQFDIAMLEHLRSKMSPGEWVSLVSGAGETAVRLALTACSVPLSRHRLHFMGLNVILATVFYAGTVCTGALTSSVAMVCSGERKSKYAAPEHRNFANLLHASLPTL